MTSRSRKCRSKSGVTITSTLSWDTQCDEIKKKANKFLGVLQSNLSSCSSSIKERAYLTLVRPLAEYATTAWSPYTVKGISKIESIQRCAARFVKQDYHRTSSVSEMITDLGWESLKQCRDKRDIELFHKIHYHLVDIPFPTEVVPAACLRTRVHDLRYSQPACAVNAYKHSFFPRAIKAWKMWGSIPAEGLKVVFSSFILYIHTPNAFNITFMSFHQFYQYPN